MASTSNVASEFILSRMSSVSNKSNITKKPDKGFTRSNSNSLQSSDLDVNLDTFAFVSQSQVIQSGIENAYSSSEDNVENNYHPYGSATSVPQIAANSFISDLNSNNNTNGQNTVDVESQNTRPSRSTQAAPVNTNASSDTEYNYTTLNQSQNSNNNNNNNNSTNTTGENIKPNTNKNKNKQKYKDNDSKSKDKKFEGLLYGLLLLARYLVLLTAYFLLVICVLYAIGSVTILEAENFYCPSYTEEEVRTHNYENGLKWGDHESCYLIDRKMLNWYAVKNVDVNIFTGSVKFNNPGSISVCIIYLLIGLFLLINALYDSYFIVYDTIFIKSNPRVTLFLKKEMRKALRDSKIKNKQKKHNIDMPHTTELVTTGSPSVIAEEDEDEKEDDDLEDNNEAEETHFDCNFDCKQCLTNVIKCFRWIYIGCYIRCLKFCLKYYYKYLKPYHYIDGKWRLITMYLRELIEIAIQIYALLLYGGVNLFDRQQNILAQESYVLRGK